MIRYKAKCKVYPRIGDEHQQGEHKYSSILCLSSTLDGVGWLTPRPDRFLPRNKPVPIVKEGSWAPGLVWTGAGNLAFTGIRSPDRPARRQSLYRLRHSVVVILLKKDTS